MADLGLALTRQHRELQLRLRARAIRDYARIWPLWQGDAGSFEDLIAAAVPLVTAHHGASATLSTSYYAAIRMLERPGGPARAMQPAELDVTRLRVALYTTGRNMTARAIAAGHAPEAAMMTALVRTTGTLSRYVLNGGRDTLVEAVRADPRAAGYERVLSANACDFCRSLAGHVRTDDFSAHDHCACLGRPSWTA